MGMSWAWSRLLWAVLLVAACSGTEGVVEDDGSEAAPEVSSVPDEAHQEVSERDVVDAYQAFLDEYDKLLADFDRRFGGDVEDPAEGPVADVIDGLGWDVHGGVVAGTRTSHVLDVDGGDGTYTVVDCMDDRRSIVARADLDDDGTDVGALDRDGVGIWYETVTVFETGDGGDLVPVSHTDPIPAAEGPYADGAELDQRGWANCTPPDIEQEMAEFVTDYFMARVELGINDDVETLREFQSEELYAEMSPGIIERIEERGTNIDVSGQLAVVPRHVWPNLSRYVMCADYDQWDILDPDGNIQNQDPGEFNDAVTVQRTNDGELSIVGQAEHEDDVCDDVEHDIAFG